MNACPVARVLAFGESSTTVMYLQQGFEGVYDGTNIRIRLGVVTISTLPSQEFLDFYDHLLTLNGIGLG
jgi:hypothetical protein